MEAAETAETAYSQGPCEKEPSGASSSPMSGSFLPEHWASCYSTEVGGLLRA